MPSKLVTYGAVAAVAGAAFCQLFLHDFLFVLWVSAVPFSQSKTSCIPADELSMSSWKRVRIRGSMMKVGDCILAAPERTIGWHGTLGECTADT
jgi:hypothetical protein